MSDQTRRRGARDPRLQAVTALAFAIVVWWSSNTVAHLFSIAVLPPAIGEPAVRARHQCRARHPADAVAGSASRASCRRRAAPALVERADAAGRGRPGVVGDADRARADVLHNGLRARLSGRPAALRAPRPLRARRRNDQLLRSGLQRAAVQRRVSRRAPCESVRAVVAAAGAPRSARARQRVAGAAALGRARRRSSARSARAAGPAVADAAALDLPASARCGVDRRSAAAATSSSSAADYSRTTRSSSRWSRRLITIRSSRENIDRARAGSERRHLRPRDTRVTLRKPSPRHVRRGRRVSRPDLVVIRSASRGRSRGDLR